MLNTHFNELFLTIVRIYRLHFVFNKYKNINSSCLAKDLFLEIKK